MCRGIEEVEPTVPAELDSVNGQQRVQCDVG